MGKAIYGHKQKRGRRRDEATSSHWLTLSPASSETGEEQRLNRAAGALRKELGDLLAEPGVEDFLASGLIEAAAEAEPSDEIGWLKLCEQACVEAGIPLRGNDDDDDDGEATSAADLVGALRRAGVICPEEPPLPPLALGDPVLAVLDEDAQWHAATIAELRMAADGGGPMHIVVRFCEWDKLQACSRTDVVPLASAIDGDDEGATEEERGGSSRLRAASCCEICEQTQRLTFHHLLPKQVHDRYVGKPLPPDCPAEAPPAVEACVSRDWLQHYGAVLCAACHAMVHRLAPNAVLAAHFSSVAVLRAEPSLANWAAWARGRQRVDIRRV